jgi:uncharacterized glyoxalase superfamily protein PhnB
VVLLHHYIDRIAKSEMLPIVARYTSPQHSFLKSKYHMNSNAIPCLRYRDAAAAIDWLCDVLGFEKHLVVPGPESHIAHAQLSHKDGGGMIMLGSVIDTDFGKLMKQPDEIGGAATQTVCIVVPNADDIHTAVTAANWTILQAIEDQDYGGRAFTCVDPEGHIWNVGTYDPWAETSKVG